MQWWEDGFKNEPPKFEGTKLTNKVIADLEAQFPMVGRLRGEDLDDEMVGAIIRDMAISEMTQQFADWRQNGRRASSGAWPSKATQQEIEAFGYRWYRRCKAAARQIRLLRGERSAL